MTIGTVNGFDATKGYGFIAPEEGDKDVFVHISAVQASGLDELLKVTSFHLNLKSKKMARKALKSRAVSAYKTHVS